MALRALNKKGIRKLKKVAVMWPYKEESTRNCLHCKVMRSRHKKYSIRAYCDLGKPLCQQMRRINPSRSMPLKDVIRYSSWFHSSCEGCSSFEHDDECIALNEK